MEGIQKAMELLQSTLKTQTDKMNDALKTKRLSFPKDKFSIGIDEVAYHEEKGNGSLLVLKNGKEKPLPNYSWEEVERLINS